MEEVTLGWQKELADAIVRVAGLIAKIIGMDIERVMESAGMADKIAVALFSGKVKTASSPYISAAVLLAFTGKDIAKERIRAVIERVGIRPDERLLDFAGALRFRKEMAYAPALYFLRVVGKHTGRSDSVENLMNVVGALGIEPDPDIAHRVIDIDSGRLKARDAEMQKRLSEGITESASFLGGLMMTELSRVFEDRKIDAYVREGLVPHFSALGVLTFVGKNVDMENRLNVEGISKLLESVGLKLDNRMIEYILSIERFGVGPNVYVSALSFLASVGEKPSVDGIMNIIEVLGIKGDSAVAGYVLIEYSKIVGTNG